MSDNTNCPFCEIAHAEAAHVREVYRDEEVVAFFPLEPATLGHTLLIPRMHVPDIWSLNDAAAAHIGVVTVRLAGAIKEAVAPEGLNIIQSNGAVATQTVQHLHVHLVPRWNGDSIGRIWPPETHYVDCEENQVWLKLRAACRRLELE